MSAFQTVHHLIKYLCISQKKSLNNLRDLMKTLDGGGGNAALAT
jgi:hypothetical protein